MVAQTYFRRFCGDGQMNFSTEFEILVERDACFTILDKVEENNVDLFSLASFYSEQHRV